MADVPYSGVNQAGTDANPTGYQGLDINPGQFGGQIGQATEHLGHQIDESEQQVFDQALYFQNIRNKTEALDAGSKFSNQVGQIESQYHQLEGTNAVDQLPGFQKQIADLQGQMAKQMRSPASSLMFQEQSRGIADNAGFRMGIHAGDQAKTAQDQAYLGNITAIRSRMTQSAVTGVPFNEHDMDELVTRSAEYGQFRGMPKPAVDAFLQKQTGDMVKDVVEATMAKGDPDSTDRADQFFQGMARRNIPGTDVPMMDGDHLAQVSQTIKSRQYFDQIKAERADAHAAAGLRTSITQTMDNVTAMVERGVTIPANLHLPDEAQIDQAYGQNPEMAEVLKDRLHNLLDMSQATQELTGATPEQVGKILQRVQPDANKPDFARQTRLATAFASVAANRAKQLNSDPASYVLTTHPEIAQVLQQTDQDPKLWANYVHAQGTLQSQMGVPVSQQHVLPGPIAKSIADQLTSNPATATQQLRAWQQKLGTDWPKAWRDVVQLGQLPAEYELVGVLPEADAHLLASTLQTRDADGKPNKAIEELLPGKPVGGQAPKTLIDSTISNSPEVQNFLRSLDQQGMSQDRRAGYVRGLERLAYAKVVSQGLDAATASGQAIGSLTQGFQYLGQARIPAERYDSVATNAALALERLSPQTVTVPLEFSQGQDIKSQAGTVLAHHQIPSQTYIDMVRANPQWVTAPEGDALLLKGYDGKLVKDQKGEPIRVPFSAGTPGVTPRISPQGGTLNPPSPYGEAPAGPFGQNDRFQSYTGEGGGDEEQVASADQGAQSRANYGPHLGNPDSHTGVRYPYDARDISRSVSGEPLAHGAPPPPRQGGPVARDNPPQRTAAEMAGDKDITARNEAQMRDDEAYDAKVRDVLHSMQGNYDDMHKIAQQTRQAQGGLQAEGNASAAELAHKLQTATSTDDRFHLINGLTEKAENATPAARREILKQLDQHFSDASWMQKMMIARLHALDMRDRAGDALLGPGTAQAVEAHTPRAPL